MEQTMEKFEVRYSRSRSQAQSARNCTPDIVREFATERQARADIPPPGAKCAMIRQIAPQVRFVARFNI
jgi:hypothetical protein